MLCFQIYQTHKSKREEDLQSSIALVIISRVIKRLVKHDLLSVNPCWTEFIRLFTFK